LCWQKYLAYLWHKDGDNSGDGVESHDDEKEDVPKIENEEDLLIYNVLCKEAQTIDRLDRTTGGDRVDGARYLGREHIAHWIVQAQTGVLHVVVVNLEAIRSPLVVEEDVGHVKVDHEEEHVEKLAEDEHAKVLVVIAQYGGEVLDEPGD
jgi:hypothetical protein